MIPNLSKNSSISVPLAPPFIHITQESLVNLIYNDLARLLYIKKLPIRRFTILVLIKNVFYIILYMLADPRGKDLILLIM